MILLLACSLKADDLYFPLKKDKADSGLSESAARWYSKCLQCMKEPQMLEMAKDQKTRMFRLTILPTWGNPIAVRVKQDGDSYLLSARRLDGDGGYDLGKLVEKNDLRLTEKDSSALNSLLASNNIFMMPTTEDVSGADGDEWVFEGVDGGVYHVINRWNVSTYETKKRGLEPFLKMCKFLIDRSGLSERPKNLGHELIPIELGTPTNSTRGANEK